MRALFLTIWQAALLDVSHALTDGFPPVHAIFQSSLPIAGAGLVLALTLLGLRTYARGITGQDGIVDELLSRLLKYVSVLSILPWIVGHAIDLEQAAAQSVAVAAVAGILPNQVPKFDLVGYGLSLIVMLFLGIRLWFTGTRSSSRTARSIDWFSSSRRAEVNAATQTPLRPRSDIAPTTPRHGA